MNILRILFPKKPPATPRACRICQRQEYLRQFLTAEGPRSYCPMHTRTLKDVIRRQFEINEPKAETN